MGRGGIYRDVTDFDARLSGIDVHVVPVGKVPARRGVTIIAEQDRIPCWGLARIAEHPVRGFTGAYLWHTIEPNLGEAISDVG